MILFGGLFKVMINLYVATNIHGYRIYINDFLYVENPKNDILYVGLCNPLNT
jgi:hypothetical protein